MFENGLISPEVLTPIGAFFFVVVLSVFAFVRGWILTNSAVERIIEVYKLLLVASDKRGDEYKEAWAIEKARNDIILGHLDKLLIVTESMDKLLKAIPAPTDSRVS